MLIFSVGANFVAAQNDKDKNKNEKSPKDRQAYESIGGKEHDADIYGVKIGMDIPTALKAVFVNANRKPGEEKPDALKKEGKDNKDIRIVYKKLPKGELQIVFAEGKFVKEIVLKYAQPIQYSDLRLPYSGDIREAIDGERFDDRYTIGYTDNQALQGIWWRDEKSEGNYKVRIVFTSSNRLKDSQYQFQKIIQKAIFVTPGDEEKFIKAVKN